MVVALPPAVPPFLLPFEKPDVRLGMGALTWRGSDRRQQPAADGSQARTRCVPSRRLRDCDRELTALASRYPGTIEILFYQGVSRLFLNDLPGAIAALDAAEGVGDRTFAADVWWYRAVAEQRSGNLTEARARLDAICRGQAEGAARGCAALDQIAKASPTPR